MLINQIPCRACYIDTKQYFYKNKFNLLKNKNEIKIFFYNFHNHVNFKLGKKIYSINILKYYEKKDFLPYLKHIDNVLFKNNINNKFYIFLQELTDPN